MLSERSRSQIFRGLAPIIGEEAVGEMLAHHPTTEGQLPVTNDHLDAKLAELRAELRIELHQGMTRLLVVIPASTAVICAVVAFVARLGA